MVIDPSLQEAQGDLDNQKIEYAACIQKCKKSKPS